MFCPKTTKFGPKLAFLVNLVGPGLFSALLMGRLVVVARGLYLARHLFTLFYTQTPSVVSVTNMRYAKVGPIQAFVPQREAAIRVHCTQVPSLETVPTCGSRLPVKLLPLASDSASSGHFLFA